MDFFLNVGEIYFIFSRFEVSGETVDVDCAIRNFCFWGGNYAVGVFMFNFVLYGWY